MISNNSSLLDQFKEQLKINFAEVITTSQKDLPQHLLKCFTKHGLPNKLVTNLPIEFALPNIEITAGKATGAELVGLSEASYGISESGTLILESTEQNPTSINFLVDHHLVLLKSNNIVENLHQAMDKLSDKQSWNRRAINFISGPSRTADIEQTIQLGAHGPRNLVVLIISN